MMAGAVAGGIVSHGIGNFSGVKGGDIVNIGAEIGFNAIKYGISGAVSGGVAAAIDKQDVGRGILSGAINGAVGGVAISSLNILTMGPAYKPEKEYGDFGRYKPVYRKGTFFYKTGVGLTLGRNLITRLTGNPIEDEYLRAHETGHYAQQISLGFGKMYQRALSEGPGKLSNYDTPGTMDFGANMYSLNKIGYFISHKFHINIYASDLPAYYPSLYEKWWYNPYFY